MDAFLQLRSAATIMEVTMLGRVPPQTLVVATTMQQQKFAVLQEQHVMVIHQQQLPIVHK